MSSRGERWDRDRFAYERERIDDDRSTMRGGRGRDHSDERHDRRHGGRGYDDDIVYDRRYYEDDRYGPGPGPPSRREPEREPEREREREPARDVEYDRRVVMEKDREYRRDSSPRRPSFLRRQSSLDTFDRRPLRSNFYDREEYPPPARREDIRRGDYRAPPYQPIPLPKTKALPAPRRQYEETDIERDYYAEEDFRRIPEERIREREIIRDTRERSRSSHGARSRRHRSASRSSSSSSRSGGASTTRSEYPKKGKTRIPARLVSKRALIDMGYPYVEEGNTIIVQKALGQDNIDELLKLSEDYNRAEEEVHIARSSAGGILEERREERREEIIIAPPAPPATVILAPPQQTVEIVDRTAVIRDVSPSRSSSSGHRHHHHHHHDDVAIIERPRSRSRSGRDIRHEIRALERELAHRPRGEISEREIVRTERLPDGQLVIYEEEIERQVVGPKPPRIEKDKKGPPPGLVRAMLATLT